MALFNPHNVVYDIKLLMDLINQSLDIYCCYDASCFFRFVNKCILTRRHYGLHYGPVVSSVFLLTTEHFAKAFSLIVALYYTTSLFTTKICSFP